MNIIKFWPFKPITKVFSDLPTGNFLFSLMSWSCPITFDGPFLNTCIDTSYTCHSRDTNNNSLVTYLTFQTDVPVESHFCNSRCTTLLSMHYKLCENILLSSHKQKKMKPAVCATPHKTTEQHMVTKAQWQTKSI